MGGWGIGGGGNGGGGLIQKSSLNIPCFLNEVANAERHIGTRARLKCGSKPVRDAIAYDVKDKKQRQGACIAYFEEVWKAEIDYLRELVADPNTTFERLIDDVQLAQVSPEQAENIAEKTVSRETSQLERQMQQIQRQQQQIQQQQRQQQEQQQRDAREFDVWKAEAKARLKYE